MDFAAARALLPAAHPWHAVLARLATRAAAPLVPAGPWDPALSAALASDLVPTGASDDARELWRCASAGLLLCNDDLDASHKLSQDLPSQTGSYWHGIMHRREPDYGNARYWFRRVGEHPLMPEWAAGLRTLPTPPEAEAARLALQAAPRDGLAMVGCCEAVHGQGAGPLRAWLEQAQWREMQALLVWCLRRAQPGA